VIEYGEQSRYAHHFDIDWSRYAAMASCLPGLTPMSRSPGNIP
jgi:maltooligosyltrehalose synthase